MKITRVFFKSVRGYAIGSHIHEANTIIITDTGKILRRNQDPWKSTGAEMEVRGELTGLSMSIMSGLNKADEINAKLKELGMTFKNKMAERTPESPKRHPDRAKEK